MLPWITRKQKSRRPPKPGWLPRPAAGDARAAAPARIGVSAPDRRLQGQHWEREAEHWLCKQGLVPVDRQWQCRWGELDLIMADGHTAVVIEVRQRARTDYGGALYSIDAAKRRRIVRATRYWWHRQGRWQFTGLRLDVVVFEGTGEPEWLVHAFDFEGSV